MTGTCLVGVDVGGTFTDVAAIDGEGALRTAKVLSTPHDLSAGVAEGLDKLELSGSRIEHFAHGTTAAVNAILTKRGARTGLITTKGFRDVLDIRRGNRAELLNYWWRPPAPLVARGDRIEVAERIGFDGEIVEPLDEDGVVAAAETLRARGVESIAICFLNSFVDDRHECRAEELVRATWPECYVCTSSGVLPEMLEFERTSTTVANAYVGPALSVHLDRLTRRLYEYGYAGGLFVMASSGHVMTVERALETPIATGMSGIAAGVMGGLDVARRLDRANVLTLDIGGTSTDVALIWGGAPRLTTEWEIEAGVPVRLPALDVHTIGAGGGSIAHVDAGGLLEVGPRSAEATPGPACYGRGGELPTTTDAQAVLGRLDADRWSALYGWPLDVAAAERAIAGHIARPLGLPLAEAAQAVIDVMVHNVADAVELVSVSRGFDPRRCSLIAYGGAGPMYGVDVARVLGISEVIVPPVPGVTSALGLMQVPPAVRLQRSLLARIGALDGAAVDAAYAELDEEGCAKVGPVSAEPLLVHREVDVRYFGQSRYLTLSAPGGSWSPEAVDELRLRFAREHEREFGYTLDESTAEIEVVNLRVVVEAPMPRAGVGSMRPARPRAAATQGVWFAREGWAQVPQWERSQLGAALAGPAVIHQSDTTIVVPPGASARSDATGSLVISL